MQRRLGGRGTRLAAVAALTAALLSGAPAQASLRLISLADPSGDAHPASSLCAVDCSGAPAPLSEPSVDVRAVTVDRAGDDLVVSFRVEDLEHVPLAQPEDVLGYQIGMEADDVPLMVMAQRTAAHVPVQAVVVVGSDGSDSRRAVASSFDHGRDTVRVTVPFPVLNDAVDDVCGSCRVDNGTTFARPFVMAYVLTATPLGPTGPLYQDLVRETASTSVVPTSGGRPDWYFGGGPFTGTVTLHGSSPACANSRPATLSITADVAFTNGASRYVGPVTMGGTGCGEPHGFLIGDSWWLRGTDTEGRTLDCPQLGGMVLQIAWWSGSFGGSCTLDGAPLEINPVPWGRYVPKDLTGSSGTVAGVLTVSARGGA